MLRRKIFRLLTFITATATAVAVAVPAYAAGPRILAVYSLPVIIGNITAWIVGIALSVSTLIATYGFLRYILAAGDPTEIEKAKSAWSNAAKGYAGALLVPVLFLIVKGWIGG